MSEKKRDPRNNLRYLEKIFNNNWLILAISLLISILLILIFWSYFSGDSVGVILEKVFAAVIKDEIAPSIKNLQKSIHTADEPTSPTINIQKNPEEGTTEIKCGKLGDLDGNGIIDLKDLASTKLHIESNMKVKCPDEADFNQDGKTDNKDIEDLADYLLNIKTNTKEEIEELDEQILTDDSNQTGDSKPADSSTEEPSNTPIDNTDNTDEYNSQPDSSPTDNIQNEEITPPPADNQEETPPPQEEEETPPPSPSASPTPTPTPVPSPSASPVSYTEDTSFLEKITGLFVKRITGWAAKLFD